MIRALNNLAVLAVWIYLGLTGFDLVTDFKDHVENRINNGLSRTTPLAEALTK